MKTPRVLVALVALAPLGFVAGAARADENYKVLGEGVRNADDGHRLQLACVGESDASGERGCDRIQFLLSKLSGESKLVGPVVEIRKEPTKEVKAFLKNLRAASDANRIEGRDFDVFPWANAMGGAKTNLKVALVVGGVAYLAGGPIFGAAAAGGFGLTLVVDLIRLPFRMKSRILTGEAFIAKDAIAPSGALTARDRSYWQLAGRKTKAKAFRRLYKTIAADDADYVATGSEACAMKGVVVHERSEDTSLAVVTSELNRRSSRTEARALLEKDAAYMLRDNYNHLPSAKNGFTVHLTFSTPFSSWFAFAGQGNSRYCFRSRIVDASGREVWSLGKRCDNLRNGLTKIARKFPGCGELTFF